MNILVTNGSAMKCLADLGREQYISLDTETTGLFLWKSDRLFSFSASNGADNFYFNFWDQAAFDGTSPEPQYILSKSILSELGKIVSDKDRVVFMHNAKFDMHAFFKEGVLFDCVVHCTETGARLERNDHLSYELDQVAPRIGLEKSGLVEQYIKDNHLWDWTTLPGKKTRIKNMKFYKVPFSIMAPYALMDAEVTYRLGMHQLKFMREFEGKPHISNVFNIERKVTKSTFSMEQFGIKIDENYCNKAIEFEDARIKDIETKFKKVTGFTFKDSNVNLATVFSALGFEVPQTEKGNPSFTDEVLENITNPAAELIREHRDASKRANTYFRSFLFHRDTDNIIHPNIRQAGTVTGRMSCKEPNLQNLSKEEEQGLLFPVRRAFVPRDDYVFVMIDYDQMEFRLMLEYAEEKVLIKKILDGFDPHQATAEETGLTRRHAKILNFGIIYGMGYAKLAHALDISQADARIFKRKYFNGLMHVEVLLRKIMRKAEIARQIHSWSGRVFHFPNPEFAYKAPNALIQGGCADVVKIAMNNLLEHLQGRRSRMLMQIHDEILFEVHKEELHIIPALKRIMESAYPAKFLPLTCSVSHSLKSWGDVVEGEPSATRNEIQDEGAGEVKPTQENRQALVCQNAASIIAWDAGFARLC